MEPAGRNLPLITIMMPVFNGEKTLPVAIASLVNQSYSNWKCIIVNDGSADGTKSYLDKLTDPRFVVINLSKNRGRAYARQTALNAAEGEFLAFLDADDFYHFEKLEKQVAVLKKYPNAILVGCGNASYGADFKIISVRGCGNDEIRQYNYGDKLKIAMRNSMMRLKEAKKINFNSNLKLAEDEDFLERYLPQRMFFEMSEVLYYYSEFVSVDRWKILITYFYEIRINFSRFFNNPIIGLREMGSVFLKIIFIIISWLFLKDEFFLNRRGRAPSSQEKADFYSALALLKRAIMINSKAL